MSNTFGESSQASCVCLTSCSLNPPISKPMQASAAGMQRMLPEALKGTLPPLPKQLEGGNDPAVPSDASLPALSWFDGAADWASKAASSPLSQAIYAGDF